MYYDMDMFLSKYQCFQQLYTFDIMNFNLF